MNKLYFGDNLVILHEHILDESLDLSISLSDFTALDIVDAIELRYETGKKLMKGFRV